MADETLDDHRMLRRQASAAPLGCSFANLENFGPTPFSHTSGSRRARSTRSRARSSSASDDCGGKTILIFYYFYFLGKACTFLPSPFWSVWRWPLTLPLAAPGSRGRSGGARPPRGRVDGKRRGRRRRRRGPGMPPRRPSSSSSSWRGRRRGLRLLGTAAAPSKAMETGTR